MNEELVLRNKLKEIRKSQKLSQDELAKMVGVSRNTISSIETGQFSPTAKLALVICIALDKQFEGEMEDEKDDFEHYGHHRNYFGGTGAGSHLLWRNRNLHQRNIPGTGA